MNSRTIILVQLQEQSNVLNVLNASTGLWDTELTNTFLPLIDHKVDHRITDPEDTEYILYSECAADLRQLHEGIKK